ncbi:MAG: hypothetical protein NVS9B1_03340 [Candidatus Dormibacteraceae bacterium]
MRILSPILTLLWLSAALAGCGLGAAGSAAPTTAPVATPAASGVGGAVLQDLEFEGKLPAHWAGADATCGPLPGKGADTFAATLTSTDLNGQKRQLAIRIESGYRGPGTYTTTSAVVLSVAGSGGADIASSSPALFSKVVVLPGAETGTLDTTMAHGADLQTAIEHVSGTWRCR